MNRSNLYLLLAASSLCLSCGADAGPGHEEHVASTTSPPPTDELRASPPPPGNDATLEVSRPLEGADPTRDVRAGRDRVYTHALDLRPTPNVHCPSPQLCLDAEHRDTLPRSSD